MNIMLDMELRDTAALMQSDDYKDRFRAEYYQLVIRYEKLRTMLDHWDKGELNFIPPCDRALYDAQLRAMSKYITALEARAEREGIELE